MPPGSDKSSAVSVKSEVAKKDRRGQARVRSRTLANGGVAGNSVRKGGAFLGTTVNLSVGGCLIRTYEALESGMEVTLCLKLPEGEVSTPGLVVHVNEDAVGCRMVGVKFIEISTDAQTLLVQHVSSFGVDPTERHPGAGGGAGRYEIEGRIHSS